jgi:sugar phosphate isomerase/epimerase
MYDQDKIGLCCGSLIQADFRGLAEAAAGAGFASISMWPTLFDAALESGLSEQDLRQILTDNALHITELDPLCSWLPISPEKVDLAGPFAGFSEDDFFRIADALGARTLNVIQATDDPIARSEVVDRLSALCERARAHELLVSVEFLPWSPIGSLQDALELVRATGQANCGVNIDTWHHFRSGGTVEELAQVDPTLVKAMQLNDVMAEPFDDLIEETSTARLLPGHGSSDSVAVLKALWEAGVRIPISAEIFNAELMGMPAMEVAQQIGDAMREVLAKASA